MAFRFIHAADLHIVSPLSGLERYEGAPVDKIRGATREAMKSLVRLAIDTHAKFVLAKRLQRYREENQAPVLKRASVLFAQLTRGSFARLDIDDTGDTPQLVGVRPEGVEPRFVRVDGMSDGTRDQLFLALRIAALEQKMPSGEPLPFIIDDALVNLDDGRAEATLRALADLAKTTQVLFFTHHSKLVEIAKSLKSPEVFVHEL